MANPTLALMVIGVSLGIALYYFFGTPTTENQENAHSRHPNSSESVRAYYPRTSANDFRNKRSYPKCTICLDDTSKGKLVSVRGCKHVFHKACIQDWRLRGIKESSQLCPMCRNKIVELEELC